MKATAIWNTAQDMAVIRFEGSYDPQEPTSMPINHILEIMYSANREGAGLKLYMYEIWNGDDFVGLLWGESMELDENEMFALYQQVIESDEAAPNSGRFERKTFDA